MHFVLGLIVGGIFGAFAGWSGTVAQHLRWWRRTREELVRAGLLPSEPPPPDAPLQVPFLEV